MEAKFDLTKKTYSLLNYEQSLEECKRFIDEVGHLNIICDDDLSYKICKDSRAKLRKKQKEIASKRLQINDIILGEFNNQVKDVEKLLKDADKILTAKMDDYENLFSAKLTITFDRREDLEKVKVLASELNLKVKEEIIHEQH